MKPTPNMSKTSRSSQLAFLQSPVRRIHDRVVPGQRDLDPEAAVAAQGKKMVDHFEAVLGRQEIDAGQVEEDGVIEGRSSEPGHQRTEALPCRTTSVWSPKVSA